MSTVRDALYDYLLPLLPKSVRLVKFAKEGDPLTRTTVMIRVDTVRRSLHASGSWEWDIALLVISRLTANGPAEDDLDVALGKVISVIEDSRNPGVLWKQATRAAYGPDNFPAYELDLTITSTKEQ